MTYRPSARLVAANAALAHWLERHPVVKKSPVVTREGTSDDREGAAAPREEEEKKLGGGEAK